MARVKFRQKHGSKAGGPRPRTCSQEQSDKNYAAFQESCRLERERAAQSAGAVIADELDEIVFEELSNQKQD